MKTLSYILWAILHTGTPKPAIITTTGVTKEDPAVVQVFTPTSSGTGFFIEDTSHYKYLVTAAHVCANYTFLISAKGVHNVLATSPTQDVCVLSTYQNVKTLPLGDDVNPGDKLSMTGFPLNIQYDYQEGTSDVPGFSMFAMPKGYYGPGCPKNSLEDKTLCGIYITTIKLKMLVRPGNSGGPVMNSTTNQVVGIAIGTDSEFGYMTPISEVLKVLYGRP